MSKGAKILVVDDNIETVEFLEATLSSFGYEIVTADNGVEALKKIENNNPDLILLDFEMPKMDGAEVCRNLRAKDPFSFIPIIMMTGNTDPGILVKSLDSGADEFVTKPFDIVELTARIKAMLRIKSLEEKLGNMNKNLEQMVKDKTRKIQGLYMETVKSLARALDAKDHYTQSHSENVTKYSVAIAKEIGLAQEEVKNIEMAAQLHDLGKIGTSDYILHKKEKLSDEDWKEIKLHSRRSAEILEPLESLDGLVEMVKQHHEKIDGSGYPDGISGKDIPIGAKILAVADAYDAMTSERPYRKAFPKEKAINELKKCTGTQFDNDIVDTFIRILETPNY
jgi:putative two-component system response regulator